MNESAQAPGPKEEPKIELSTSSMFPAWLAGQHCPHDLSDGETLLDWPPAERAAVYFRAHAGTGDGDARAAAGNLRQHTVPNIALSQQSGPQG